MKNMAPIYYIIFKIKIIKCKCLKFNGNSNYTNLKF